MDAEMERLDAEQLRRMSTPDLVRHALEEARLLARAEVLIAKQELQEEMAAAKVSGIFLGAGGTLAVAGLALLLVAVALALPLAPWLGPLLVGVFVLGVAAVLGAAGKKRLPRRPLPRTQERLKSDLTLAREQLQ